MLNKRIKRTTSFLAAALLAVLSGCVHQLVDEQNNHALLEDQLKSYLAGESPSEQIEVTYSDMHGLWGGLTLSVSETGEIEQEFVNVEVPPAGDFSPSEFKELVMLLVEIEAWDQKVPDRTPVPDESKATLTIETGSSHVKIWEWFNDLEQNNRLVKVRDLMQEYAWE